MRIEFDLQPVLGFDRALKRNTTAIGAMPVTRILSSRGPILTIPALTRDLSRCEPLTDLGPGDCVVRRNRDLRFTKEKTPNNPRLKANTAAGGRRSQGKGSYVHLKPGYPMLAGAGE